VEKKNTEANVWIRMEAIAFCVCIWDFSAWTDGIFVPERYSLALLGQKKMTGDFCCFTMPLLQL